MVPEKDERKDSAKQKEIEIVKAFEEDLEKIKKKAICWEKIK